MKSYEMKPLVAYKATKSSTDGTVIKGDSLWLSENGMLNVCTKNGGGFLNKEEWDNKGTNDFEVEEDRRFIIVVSRGSESMAIK